MIDANFSTTWKPSVSLSNPYGLGTIALDAAGWASDGVGVEDAII
jgi:hypothetical protein